MGNKRSALPRLHSADEWKRYHISQRKRGAMARSKKASVGHSTLDALENNRLGELGFSKITKILSALGLELKLQEASSRRPTLEELMEEERNDQGLDRRR